MEEKKDIKTIQNELRYLLSRFSQHCNNCGIRYSIHGGTMLGAVRSGGFIPWDDDIDITFTREEYEAFVDSLQYLNCDDIWFDDSSRISKLCMHRDGLPFVWLDFFVYDYVSSGRVSQIIKTLGLVFFLSALKTPEDIVITKLRGKYTGIKLIPIIIFSSIGRLFNRDYLMLRAKLWDLRFSGNKACVQRTNDQFAGMKIILPANAIKGYTTICFEGIQVMIHSQYDEILKSSYGENYMTPIKYADDMVSHNKSRSRLMDERNDK